jgi:hypothetical protein
VTRRSVAAIALAAACAAVGGAAAWRAGWLGRGLSPSTIASPAGGEPDSWSATVVRTFVVNGLSTTSTTEFARSGDRTRLEWIEGERRMALVTRPDLSVSWLVDVSDNSYVEIPLGPDGAPAPSNDSDPLSVQQIEAAIAAGSPADGFVARRERIGEETVEGYACTVYRSRIEAIDGTATEATVWEAPDFAGLAIRSEIRSASGNTVRTDLQRLMRDPPPVTFELTPGARRAGQTP